MGHLSPNTFPAYVAALKRWIYKQDERFKPLVECAYVNTSKDTSTACPTIHIDRIRHRLDAVGTLSTPRQIVELREKLV